MQGRSQSIFSSADSRYRLLLSFVDQTKQEDCSTPAVAIRNLPSETHRALTALATRHGRSTEAEIRALLETAVRPSERVKLGSLLASIGHEAKLTEAEAETFAVLRDKTPVEPEKFA